jgi:prolyl-tRNA synthetase
MISFPSDRVSSLFLPTTRELPADAHALSHQLMLRAGLIRQTSAGIYAWLPLGYRVLRHIEQIVREEQNRINAQEMLMPTIQNADIWQTSGRYDNYGPEMLRLKDRHNRDMLYGPTNEEMITQLFAQDVHSYKNLPLSLYHIQWKFRDEIRPRFGVMRGREFLMKDAYSFDISEKHGLESYYAMFAAYLRTFERLGLKAIPMQANTGPIGGNKSHEFVILAETGESRIFCDARLLKLNASQLQGTTEKHIAPWLSFYAATDDEVDMNLYHEQVPPEYRLQTQGIEVGHIFFFGDKYSIPLGAFVETQNGQKVPVQMGSYGIGISRLAGAIIEACHDENGIVWPSSIAPYLVGIINIKNGDLECDSLSQELFSRFQVMNIPCLLDDRNERPGVKFKDMDLIGIPWHIIIGPKNIKEHVVEIKNRKSGERSFLSFDQLESFFKHISPHHPPSPSP